MKTATKSYKDLMVWQKAMDLVTVIYEISESFPREEVYGLTSQMRRAAVAIPSNIAEGRHRGTKNDYMQFLRIAYSSGAELETQIEIARRLFKTRVPNFAFANSLLTEVMKMLNAMIRNFNPRS